MTKRASGLRAWLLCVVVLPLLVRADDPRFAPLPAWSEEEQAILQAHPDTPLLLGGLLWPRGAQGGLNVHPDLPIITEAEQPVVGARPPVLADSPDLAQPVTDIEGFLPPAPAQEMELKPEKLEPTPAHALKPTAAEFAEVCYQADPEHYVIDPSYHLTELEREDVERFLAYHAGDAKIRAMLLVIGRDEVLDKGFDLTRLAQGSVLRDNTALLVLPVDEPWRARLFFSINIHQGAKSSDLAEVLGRVVEQGKQNPEREEQLHRMLVEFSILLFQLEQKLSPPAPVKPVTVAAQEKTVVPAPVELAEVFTDEALPVVMLRRTLGHPYAPWMLYSALILLAVLVWIRWKTYRSRHYEWILPDAAPAAPRLGGEFAGGGGAMIAYR